MKNLEWVENEMKADTKKMLKKLKPNKRKYLAIFLLVSVTLPFLLIGLTFLTLFIIGITGGYT